MDTVFLLTLLFIFLTALVGTYVTRRSRDRCLKDFAGFHVVVELKDGDLVWGRLAVFSNGLELFYPRPHPDPDGHLETSFILLGDQLAGIQAIYRYHDELSDENQRRRRAEIRRTHHPNLLRRSMRWLRNFLNTFRDAFSESIGAVLSKAKESTGSPVVQTQDRRLAQIGESVLGAVANAYEPILERYIGRRVVVEESRGGEWVEHSGILKEYTAQWLELLDCRFTQESVFSLAQLERLRLNRNLDFIVRKRSGKLPEFEVRVENHGPNPVRIKRLEAEGYTQRVDAEVSPGGAAEFAFGDLPETAFQGIDVGNLPFEIALRAEPRLGPVEAQPDETPPLPDLRLVVEAVREVDLCLPRRHAFVRHGGEPLEDWLASLRKKI